MTTDSKYVEGRNFLPVVLGGGLDQVTSKFTVYPGSLQDCLNYESSDTGYTRSQGLLFFDGTYDSAVEDMWYIGAQLSPRVDAIMPDPTLSFTVGDRATWGEGNSGVVVYWNIQYGTYDYVELGIAEVIGVEPQPGDTIVDGSSGAQLQLQSGMAYPATTLEGAVHPGTGVQLANTISKYLAYINGTVNTSVAGQPYVPGSLYFHGKLPGEGAATGGFQYLDTVYGVRDYYAIGFDNGDTEIFPTDVISVYTPSGPIVAEVALCVQESGDWSEGNAAGYIVFKPQLTASTAWDVSTPGTYYAGDTVSHGGIEYLCLLTHASASTNEPGEGVNWTTYWGINDIKYVADVVDLAQILDPATGDQWALVNTANKKSKGALWKATKYGWQAFDTGYTITYDTGTTAPVCATVPMFLTDVVSDGYVQTAGYLAPDNAFEVGTAPLNSWTGVGNIAADDATYATASVGVGDKTTYLFAQISADAVPDADAKVVGIQVKINAKANAASAVKIKTVQLVDSSTGASQYLSADLGDNAELTATDADYIYGSQTEVWSFPEALPTQAILDAYMYVRIQFEGIAAASTVSVDAVSIQVHYVPKVQHAYVNDGTSDVSEVDISAFQILGAGAFSTNDAEGTMTLYNVTDAKAIKSGMILYSGAGATGDTIATITTPPVYNLLPSEANMTTNASKYQSIVANFREVDDGRGVYVATGASPAFMLEHNYFSFIRTPQWIKYDKPRHIAFHKNYLALGFSAGSVIFSAVGVPNDFSAGAGAQYPTGGAVTGLASMTGDGILGVWTDRRTMTLSGIPTTDMQLKVIKDSSGATEYTVQDIGTPYFADFRGLSTINTTDKYGDFDLGRISFKITPFLKDRLQARRSIDTIPKRPIASLTARNKNQYRLFFEDGYILTMTFFESKAPEFTLQHYDTTSFGTDFVPTFTNSYVLSNGRERNIMGTSDGSVWVVDGANGIQDSTGLTALDAYIVLNPTNLQRPEGVNKFYHTVIQGQFFGWQQVQTWGATNYIFNENGAAHDTANIGDSGDAPVFVATNNLDATYVPVLADGFSFKIQTSLDGSKPHTLQSLLFRASGKGTDRNRTTRAY